MAQLNYAFIKNGEVVNISVFEDSINNEIFELFKETHSLDDILLANENAAIGGTYDGSKFWPPSPFPSWVKDQDTNQWIPPIPCPEYNEEDPKLYVWDEETTSWIIDPIKE
jgi:hypothetical protein